MIQDETLEDQIYGDDGSNGQIEESIVEASRINRIQRENALVANTISVSRITPTRQGLTEALFNPIVEKINELVEAAEQYASFLIKRSNPVKEDENDDYIPPTILTKQPTILKNGILKDYQIDSLNWLIALYECGINGILADEMGLGKTVQTISLIGYLRQYKGITKHFLIVAPKSTLGNWILEFQYISDSNFRKWLPQCRVIKLIAVVDQRKTIIDKYLSTGEFDVCVTSFEGVTKCFSHLKKYKFKYLIIDEAHKLKNDQTINHQVLKSLNTQYKLFLTGTPLQNNPHELWCLLNFLLPDLFHSSDVFDQVLRNYIQYKWFEVQAKSIEENLSSHQVKIKNQELVIKFQRVLRPFMMRRTKLEVEKFLPLKKEIHLFINLTRYQKELYKKILLGEALDEKSETKNRLQNKLMQLRKVCLHPYLFPDTEDKTLPELGEHLIDVSGKMKVLDIFLKKLNQEGHQVLIFSQFTTMLNIIEDYCTFRQYSYCRIDGNTDIVLREEQIADFTSVNSDKFLFLLSTRAGGLGINLASADRVILFDSDFNPQIDLQAMDRAHRIGQKNPVLVYRLVCKNTIEEKIIERQQVKLRWDKMIIQQGQKSGMKAILTKNEMIDIVQHGASKIFAETDEPTEQDIEEILAQGEKLTKEMSQSIDKKMGITPNETSEYELGLKSINIYDFFAEGQRDQDTAILTAKKLELLQNMKKKIAKLPLLEDFLTPIVVEDYQLYPNKDLVSELKKKQHAYLTYQELQDKQIPILDQAPSPLDASQQIALDQQLAAGFPDWTFENYKKFVSACSKFGRNEYDKIASHVGRSKQRVMEYNEQFFRLGEENNLDPDYFLTDVINQIERMETKLEKIKENQQLVESFLHNSDELFENFRFDKKSYKRIIINTIYTENFDKLLILGIQEVGFANWLLIKNFALNHPLQDQLNLGQKYITENEVQQRIYLLMKVLQAMQDKKNEIQTKSQLQEKKSIIEQELDHNQKQKDQFQELQQEELQIQIQEQQQDQEEKKDNQQNRAQKSTKISRSIKKPQIKQKRQKSVNKNGVIPLKELNPPDEIQKEIRQV